MRKVELLKAEWLEESLAAQQAKSLGLTHVSFGKYANAKGNVTHVSKNGRLVKVNSDTTPSEKYGKFESVTVIDIDGAIDDPSLHFETSLGLELIPENINKICCIPPGQPDDSLSAHVAVDLDEVTIRVINVSNGNWVSHRAISFEDEYVENLSLDYGKMPAQVPKGEGAKAFSSQVAILRQTKIKYIQCSAVGKGSARGGSSNNGYYTWPRLGYNARIPASAATDAQKKFGYKCQHLSDLMATQEGRDWWKENGSSIFEAVFELIDDSYSLRVLEAYMQEVGNA